MGLVPELGLQRRLQLVIGLTVGVGDVAGTHPENGMLLDEVERGSGVFNALRERSSVGVVVSAVMRLVMGI